MNKKEFEDKIIKLIEDNIYDAEPSRHKKSRLVIGGTAVERVWQWIEQQIKQAQIDENEWWIKRYNAKGGIQDDLEAIHFLENRIKELEK